MSDLERFVDAQQGTYEQALTELRRGHKTGHWIWFVFPQIAGLGSSPMSQRFSLSGSAEARQYADHPVLGPRLREAARATLASGRGAAEMLGDLDAMKLRSSMTLFHLAVPEEAVFGEVLDHLYGGELDPATRQRL